jgi:hypothetical protein
MSAIAGQRVPRSSRGMQGTATPLPVEVEIDRVGTM